MNQNPRTNDSTSPPKDAFSVASPCIFFIFYENKCPPEKFDILWLEDAHSPQLKQHLALTMATAMCLGQSAASPKHQNSVENVKAAALFWLHSRNGWGILSVSGMG